MTLESQPPRVLIIAASDSGAGAGLQADMKTVMALGGYATTAVTAITAQNTLDVFEVAPVDPFLVERQIEVVLEDIGADAIKTGALHSRATVELVARALERCAPRVPLVVDPVIASSSGRPLLDAPGVDALVARLLPMCAVVTPNTVEAGLLTGIEVVSRDTMFAAADQLLLRGASAVLVKGGHLEGSLVCDLLRTADGIERWYEAERIETRSTHGTGCTLASALATGIAEGLTLEAAVTRARDVVRLALGAAPHGIGAGNGPLGHGAILTRTVQLEPAG